MEERKVVCNVAARTDIGLVRTENEDCWIMADLVTGQTLPEACQLIYLPDGNSLLLAVSDGVGGKQYGEVASEMTVLKIKDTLVRLPKEISAFDRLVAAVEEANNVVWNEKLNNPAAKGMAATVTAALVEDDQAFIAEVGNSRAYLIRGGNIRQVTTDQSLVAHFVAKGLIKPEQAAKHPRKNIILQGVGMKEAISVAVSLVRLKRGDSLLLCTHGLSDLLHGDEICHITDRVSPGAACEHLVELAKQRGGQDNITVILAKFEGEGLNSKTTSNRYNSTLETLSKFDPEQKNQKTHKRTGLLGDSSIRNKHNRSGEHSRERKFQMVTSLGAFPYSEVIRQECLSLMQYLDYCQEVLRIKTEQIEQAAQWLESQGCQYSNLDDMLTQIKSGLGQIAQVKQVVDHLMEVLSNTQS